MGARKPIKTPTIQRVAENDKIVTRHVGDAEFQRAAFPLLMRETVEATHATRKPAGDGGHLTDTCPQSGKTGAP